MKTRITTIFSLIFSFCASSQVNVQWESRYTSAGNNTDQVADMEIDAAGNVYVTGSSFNGPATGYDIVTVKYNNQGVQQWVVTYNGPANLLDQANALALDAAGNVYVTGYTYMSGTNADFIILKYDPSGALVWSMTRDRAGFFDQARDISVSQVTGDVYVTGMGQENAAGTNTDYMTVKYNNSGVFQWQQNYSTDVASPAANLDEAFKITLDAADNVYVTGNSSGTTSVNNLDMLTIKYNSAGTLQWRTRYNYNGNFETPSGIVVDGSGNVYVTGFGYFNALQDANYITLKYNASGAQQWVQTYNGEGSAYDKANAIVLDGSGNVYVTGRSIGATSAEDFYTISYDPLGVERWNDRLTTGGSFYEEATAMTIDAFGNLYVTGYSYQPATNNDFFTVKYDPSDGTRVWATRFDGPASNTDRAFTIHTDADGNVYVSGSSNGTGTGSDYSTIKYCQHKTTAGADQSICEGASAALSVSSTAGSNYTWTAISGDPIQLGVNFSCNPCANPTASPTITTVYTVSSESVSGCVDIDTLVLFVNPLPGPVITSSGPLDFCNGSSIELSVPAGQAGYNWSTGDIINTITVTTAGFYQVTVIDALGCANSADVTVTVYNEPPIDAGTATPICVGQTVQLQATGGIAFQWDADNSLSAENIPNPMATPTSSSWYYVTGADVNGCQARDSVFVVVNPLPAVPTIIRLDPNLISSYVSGNQWYLDGVMIPGATAQTHVFLTNGNYTVMHTDVNGCSSESGALAVIDVSVGDIYKGLVKVYPIPVGQDGIIRVEADFAIQTVQLYDAAGRVVFTGSANGQASVSISMQGLAEGMYHLQVAGTNNERILTKVIR